MAVALPKDQIPQAHTLLRIDHHAPEDMAFVLACLRFGAISLEEFKLWLFWAISQVEHPPKYVYALMNAWDEPGFDAPFIARILPADLGDAQTVKAIVGIGYARRLKGERDVAAQLMAMSLEDAPQVAERMVRLFPMLELERVFAKHGLGGQGMQRAGGG